MDKASKKRQKSSSMLLRTGRQLLWYGVLFFYLGTFSYLAYSVEPSEQSDGIKAPDEKGLSDEGLAEMIPPMPDDYLDYSDQLKVTMSAVCGNGVKEGGEECDDGNFSNGDGCSSVCLKESICGDGNVDPNEECDDGNQSSGDGCSSLCETERIVCGNGELEEGEACDDGNREDGDGCSAGCAVEKEMGNAVLDAGEECDDGNLESGDGCSPAGLLEICGDGVLQSWEECENDSQCDEGSCVDCVCSSCPGTNQCKSDSDCGSYEPRMVGNDCVRTMGSCGPSMECPSINVCQSSDETEGGAWDALTTKTVKYKDASGCDVECSYEVRTCGGAQSSALIKGQISGGEYSASITTQSGASTIKCSCIGGQAVSAGGDPDESNACSAVLIQPSCAATI